MSQGLEYTCPACGTRSHAKHLGADDGELIEGRCAICFQCNALLMWDNGAFREVSKEEIDAMPADFFLGLTTAKAQIGQLRERVLAKAVKDAKNAGKEDLFAPRCEGIGKNLRSFYRWARDVAVSAPYDNHSPAQQIGWTDLVARLGMVATMAQMTADHADKLPHTLADAEAELSQKGEGDA